MKKDIDVCPVCGLPKDLCVCGEVHKNNSQVTIKVEKKKYGKAWATISGLDMEKQELKQLLKDIKTKMACAGTIKDKKLEVLFGKQDRTNDLIEILVKAGFDKNYISYDKKI